MASAQDLSYYRVKCHVRYKEEIKRQQIKSYEQRKAGNEKIASKRSGSEVEQRTVIASTKCQYTTGNLFVLEILHELTSRAAGVSRRYVSVLF